jgi:sporulation protein YlmC with PRC-barrel domain
MSKENIAGPTILWSDLKDKKVKSNNGKKLGHIKRISQNHFRIEKGSVRKKSFWVPKNVADAYDGKYLWLRNNEEEIHDTFFYGEEPTEDDKITPVEKIRVVNERVSGVPTDPSSSSEPYKNMRDLK